MCLGTFSRLRRSLATFTLYVAVRILAERFCFTGKQFPVKQKIRRVRYSANHEPRKMAQKGILQHTIMLRKEQKLN